MIAAQLIDQYLGEKKWSAAVDTKWEPPKDFFTQSAEKIAAGLKSASDDLETAMGRLNFYINRAGKNLSAEDKKRLDAAKEKLSALYKKKESIETTNESRRRTMRNLNAKDLIDRMLSEASVVESRYMVNYQTMADAMSNDPAVFFKTAADVAFDLSGEADYPVEARNLFSAAAGAFRRLWNDAKKVGRF
jgi:exonuclease VII small subunit